MNSVAEPSSVNSYTWGDFANEDASKADLDRRLEESKLFKTYKEVGGFYIQPRLDLRYCTEGDGLGSELRKPKTPRIDRLLLPTPRLINGDVNKRKWIYGAIGIECKKSESKIGPPVAQCIDYAGAVFRTPEYGVAVMLSWVFLWPLESFAGDIASIMTQYRVGGIYGSNYSFLNFKTACGHILRVRNSVGPQAPDFEIGSVRSGYKVGSR